VSTGLLRSMGIILRTQKMAAGHAAAAFHKHCIKLHYGWLERRLSPSSFSLERRGRSQRIVLDPGIHVQQAPLHNPAQAQHHLFDRDILSPVRDMLFMKPPNIPHHRLDGTVARCEGESTHIPWHSFALGQHYIPGLIFHTCAPHNAPTFHVNLQRHNGCHCRARNNALLCST
jgi:hypothetical protein